jgi:hypothetical protein
MNYLKNIMQKEGRSNKEGSNEIKVMKQKKECDWLAECRLRLD